MFRKLMFTKRADLAVVILRVAISALMLNHGYSKLSGFTDSFHKFPDPLGAGHETSYLLTVFAEFFCSLLLIAGLFTRLAVIPLIINMLVIVFIMHANDPWGKKEFAVLYLVPYLVIFVAGPDKYSLDNLFFGKGK